MMELVHNKALALANPSDNYMVVPDKGQDGNNANFTPVERPTATAVDFEKSGNNVVHESYSDLNNSTSTESVDERNSGENSDASITTVSESDRKCKNSVAMVGSKRPLDQSVVERKFDPCCKENVTNSVHIIKRKWMNVAPIHPALFLEKLLRTRGYDTSAIDAMLSKKQPSMKQVQDYDNELVWAVRNSNLEKLKELSSAGKSMLACNRYSESIVHMACRRSELDVIEFILANGGSTTIIDDYGRTPLHDACWRPTPRFDVVTRLLDENLDLIRHVDARGSSPLEYVREEHWLDWCAYLYNQKDKYWRKIEECAKVTPVNSDHAADEDATNKKQKTSSVV